MRFKPSSLFLSALIIFASCVTDDEPDNSGVSVGDPLPHFSVTLDDGTHVSDVSLKGKVAVIELFNTSCQDCRRSFPVMQQLYEWSREEDDIFVFAIARDEDHTSVAGYWHDNDLTIPFSPQPDRQVYNLFATSGIPRIFIADKTGVVTAAFAPEDEPTLQTLVEAVEEAVASVLSL